MENIPNDQGSTENTKPKASNVIFEKLKSLKDTVRDINEASTRGELSSYYLRHKYNDAKTPDLAPSDFANLKVEEAEEEIRSLEKQLPPEEIKSLHSDTHEAVNKHQEQHSALTREIKSALELAMEKATVAEELKKNIDEEYIQALEHGTLNEVEMKEAYNSISSPSENTPQSSIWGKIKDTFSKSVEFLKGKEVKAFEKVSDVLAKQKEQLNIETEEKNYSGIVSKIRRNKYWKKITQAEMLIFFVSCDYADIDNNKLAPKKPTIKQPKDKDLSELTAKTTPVDKVEAEGVSNETERNDEFVMGVLFDTKNYHSNEDGTFDVNIGGGRTYRLTRQDVSTMKEEIYDKFDVEGQTTAQKRLMQLRGIKLASKIWAERNGQQITGDVPEIVKTKKKTAHKSEKNHQEEKVSTEEALHRMLFDQASFFKSGKDYYVKYNNEEDVLYRLSLSDIRGLSDIYNGLVADGEGDKDIADTIEETIKNNTTPVKDAKIK